MLTNCIMEEMASGSEMVLCHVPLRVNCIVSFLGILGEGGLKYSHSIVEGYRPSTFVAMSVGGGDRDVGGVRDCKSGTGGMGGGVRDGRTSKVSYLVCNQNMSIVGNSFGGGMRERRVPATGGGSFCSVSPVVGEKSVSSKGMKERVSLFFFVMYWKGFFNGKRERR